MGRGAEEQGGCREGEARRFAIAVEEQNVAANRPGQRSKEGRLPWLLSEVPPQLYASSGTRLPQPSSLSVPALPPLEPDKAWLHGAIEGGALGWSRLGCVEVQVEGRGTGILRHARNVMTLSPFNSRQQAAMQQQKWAEA